MSHEKRYSTYGLPATAEDAFGEADPPAPVSPIATQEQEVGLAIYDQWAHSDQKSHTLARLIAEAIRAALSSAERRAEAFIAGGAMPPPRSAPVRPDQSRDALTQVVFAAWGALDNAEETASGYVLDRGDVDKLADAMDALSALVPDSEQPFGGGFPARYLWDRAVTSLKAEVEELKRERDDANAAASAMSADVTKFGSRLASLTGQVEDMRERAAKLIENITTGRGDVWLQNAFMNTARAIRSLPVLPTTGDGGGPRKDGSTIAEFLDVVERMANEPHEPILKLAPTGRETSGEET